MISVVRFSGSEVWVGFIMSLVILLQPDLNIAFFMMWFAVWGSLCKWVF